MDVAPKQGILKKQEKEKTNKGASMSEQIFQQIHHEIQQ